VRVRDLQIQGKDENDPLITIPLFEVMNVSVDVLKKNVNIPAVKARDARFVGWVNEDGTMNYQTLFAPVGSATDSPEPVSSPAVEPESGKPEAPWTVMVEDVDLDNFTIDVEDRQPATPVRLLVDALHFHTSQVSSTLEQPLPIDLSFHLNETGKAALKGTVAIEPLSVKMDVSLADIALKPFQPYLSPFVQFNVGGGALMLTGQTHYQSTSKTEPMVTYAGSIGVSKLALVDPNSSQSFLRWDALAFKGLSLNVEPTSIKLQEVALIKPAVVLSIDQDGSSNMKRLFAPPEQSDEQRTEDEERVTEETSAPPLPVQVDTVRFDNLQLKLADRSITPHVTTKIEEFSGTIKGLSSEQLAKADVDLAGKVDRYAPFRIQGQINPLSEDAYTDLKVSFKNLALTTVSPYSGKFAGYPIKKGKLSLDLTYKLSERELVGENKVLVDQITMGNWIESPDATSLPIPLALALLKDRKGQIDIDLPVRGNLDDPDFSYGGIIWKALVNLIVTVATSPFSIVGGLVGGNSDDLQFVAFLAGADELSPAEQEKLAALGKALTERPGLRLDITGAADPDMDVRALAEAKLLTQLKKAKFVQQPPSGDQASVSVELLELTNEEEAEYLMQLYVKKFGALPISKVEGMPKAQETGSEGKSSQALTVAEMKAKLLEGIFLDEGQLRVLAQQRAQQIRDYLIQEGKVQDNQVFLVEVAMNPMTEEGMVHNPLALTAN
jgi:flagellar motor protein MotB